MATVINDPGCTISVVSNTGLPNCDLKPDKFIGAILVPRNKVFSVADVADIVHVLYDLALGVSGARVYPIYYFTEVKDDTEDETVVTSAYGDESVTKDGKYRWQFKVRDNQGIQWWAKLLSFKNTNAFDILMIDDNNTIWGKEGSTAGTLMGYTLNNFYPKNWKINDGSKPTEFWLKIGLADPSELNQNIAYIKPATSVKDNVKGNIDVVLTSGGAAALHTVKVIVKTEIGAINLYDTYPVALTQTGAWVVTKAGVAKTVSSVTASSVYNGFTLTLSDDSAGDALVVSLATPAALFALTTPIGGPPDEGFESNTLAVSIPS